MGANGHEAGKQHREGLSRQSKADRRAAARGSDRPWPDRCHPSGILWPDCSGDRQLGVCPPHPRPIRSLPQGRPHMDRDLDALLGFAPDYDAPIPYMQRTRDYYAAIGYTTPYRWAHYVEAPFTPLRKPLAAVARDHRHHRGAVPAGQGRPGTRRALQRRREVLPGLFRRHVAARTTCASRTSATTATTPRPRTAAPGSRCRRCCAPCAAGRIGARRRRASTARRPTAATASRWRPTRRRSCAAAGRTAPTPRSWCRTARSATRPAAWSRATWRRTASPPW